MLIIVVAFVPIRRAILGVSEGSVFGSSGQGICDWDWGRGCSNGRTGDSRRGCFRVYERDCTGGRASNNASSIARVSCCACYALVRSRTPACPACRMAVLALRGADRIPTSVATQAPTVFKQRVLNRAREEAAAIENVVSFGSRTVYAGLDVFAFLFAVRLRIAIPSRWACHQHVVIVQACRATIATASCAMKARLTSHRMSVCYQSRKPQSHGGSCESCSRGRNFQ